MENVLAFLRRAAEILGGLHKVAALLVALLETFTALFGRGRGFGFAT